MRFLILNADTPTGFYLINCLLLREGDIDAIIVGDGQGDNYIHPDINYHNPTENSIYTFKSNNYDCIFYVGDTHRLYHSFVEDIYAIINFKTSIVAIFDWEIYNGVKRGNFPVSTATPTRPDNLRGVSKVWIKDTLLYTAKKTKLPISVLVTPTVLSPFQFTEYVRKDEKNYLSQKLWEIMEGFKTGENVEINNGDMRVIYDVIHNIDVARGAINLFEKSMRGYYMLSSNKSFRFKEILQIFYGRLINSSAIKIEETNIVLINKRRSIENFDTTIDMVLLWSDVIYFSLFTLDNIFDDIINTVLNNDKDYEISEKVISNIQSFL